MPERGLSLNDEQLDPETRQRLDALERRAIDAWSTLGADGESPAEEDRVDESFVERVMDALEASQPRLVLLETPAPTAAPGTRWWQRPGVWLSAAAAAALLAVGIDREPEGPPAEGVAVLAELAASDTAFDDASEEGEGDTADPEAAATLPEGFGHDVESYIAEWGPNYGPAFRFHGVVVVMRHGKVAYRRSFGVANPDTGDPNTADTRFRLGLLTEPITATAIMQLQEDGLLDVDDPLSRYLPDYPRASQITLRDLLSHRSGIPNYTDDPGFPVWKALPHRTSEMLDRFSGWPLEFEPGADVLPSNSNYMLLGAVIERITAESYGDYIQRNVFIPAGMRDSRFGDDFSDGRQARGNVWNENELLDPPEPLDMSTFGAAGGLVSTPNDLVRFERALRDGTLISSASLRQMTEPDEDGYGFGWIVSRAYGQKLLSFPGAIDGYSGAILHFVEHETSVIVLANTEVVPGSMIAQDIALMLYGDSPPHREEPVEIKIAPGTYHKYVGTWGLTDRSRDDYADLVLPERIDMLRRVHVEQQEDRLYFDVPGHARTWMHPMGHERFFFKDHSGNQVSFELGEDRRAAKLFVHTAGSTIELRRLDDQSAKVAP